MVEPLPRRLPRGRDQVRNPVIISYGVVAACGLAFGSFLNVCIFRLPKGQSVIAPRSHCPRCGQPIRWYDNIPVVSYLMLRGRCRDCHDPISVQYPLVEISTAAILVTAFARYQLSPEFIKAATLGMLCLILVFTDLKERRIPHPITLAGIGLGFLFSLLTPVDNRPLGWLFDRLGLFPEGTWASVVAAGAGALAGGGLFYAVGTAFYYAGGRQKEYLGFGDVMMMLMVGSFLGPALTLMTILLGSILGTLIAVPLTVVSPRFRNYAWPYGSFLGAAAISTSLGGPAWLEAYLRWSGIR